ncbi:MAG TPA: histidine kinase [Clostridiales bacterium]|nr:histidine kinase [Clostridiales bacterium]
MNLRRRVVGILVITIIPAILCMFFVSFITYQTIRNQIYSTSFDTLSLYCNQIDNELKSTVDNVRNIDFNEDYIDMFQSSDRSENYYAANNYKKTITPIISMLDYVEGIVAFCNKSGATVYNFNVNLDSKYSNRQNVILYLKDHTDELSKEKNQWRWFRIGEKYYLIYSYVIRETYFCAWTSVDSFVKVTENWKIAENGTIYITTEDNQIMAESGEGTGEIDLSGDIKSYYLSGNRFLVLGITSGVGNFKIMEALNVRHLTWTFERIFYVTIGILVVFLMMIPVILKNLNHNIFLPMGRMQKAIAAIDRGELNYRMEPFHANTEFQNLIEAFNSMVRQIENLKIETYEDKIEQSRIMMQYLQLQIEPHFYLNALNTISAMAQVGDTDLILKLSKNLSDYMRFITKTKNGIVTIKEELEHIQNYMEIIEIRLGNEFTYMVEMEEELELFKIPPLAIQNLVENVMKYAFNIYENTEITIKIHRTIREGQKGVSISVEDNGNGYPEDIIQSFNLEAEEEGNRIGLQNIRKRLYYLYGDKATFRISNREEGGARAEIWIQID